MKRTGTIRGKINKKYTEDGFFLFEFSDGCTHEIPIDYTTDTDRETIRRIRKGMDIVISYDKDENYIPDTVGF